MLEVTPKLKAQSWTSTGSSDLGEWRSSDSSSRARAFTPFPQLQGSTPLLTGCLDTCLPDSSSEPDYNFKKPQHPPNQPFSFQAVSTVCSQRLSSWSAHRTLPTGLYLPPSLYQIDCLCQRLESSAPPIISFAALF